MRATQSASGLLPDSGELASTLPVYGPPEYSGWVLLSTPGPWPQPEHQDPSALTPRTPHLAHYGICTLEPPPHRASPTLCNPEGSLGLTGFIHPECQEWGKPHV